MEYIIETENLTKQYGTQRSVADVNIHVVKGKIYGLLGRNGAGKTTLLSLLAGLDSPTGGTILYEGEDVLAKGLNHHRKHHVSLVFQEYNLIDYLTTEENVKLGGTVKPEELLSKVNIPQEAWKRNVMKLSGGQQQRVAIARALASNAKVLLADEPTGNLDSRTSDEVIELLKASGRKFHQTIVMITHNPEIAVQADRRIRIEDGNICE